MDLFGEYGGERAFLLAMRAPREKREAIEAIIAREHTLTDVLLIADRGLQTEVREALTGVRRSGRTVVYDMASRSIRMYRLRTVDGKPFGPLKVRPREGTARELRRLSMMGQSLAETRDFGADFEVPADVGLMMLSQWGYGLTRPRRWRRNAPAREEKDAYGALVQSVDRWRVVEVGSVMEDAARRASDLVEPAQKGRRTGTEG